MDNSFAYFSNSKLASVRIIALEDDITIGSLLNAMLGELYTFEHVTTIKAFQQRFVSLQPDIVLLDLNLPDGKGIDLCKTIRTGSINKEVVVIIMTGDASQTTVNEAYSAGATDYIRKPFFPEELLAKIRILAENTVSKRNLKQLYDGVKLFNKKLYKLTAIINSNINEIGKTDIISSIEDVLNILDSQYFEIVLFATPSNHIFQTSKSPNTKFISYDKLLELKPKFKKSNVVNTSLKIKNKKYTIHL